MKDEKLLWDRKTVSYPVTRVPQFDSGSHADFLTTNTERMGILNMSIVWLLSSASGLSDEIT